MLWGLLPASGYYRFSFYTKRLFLCATFLYPTPTFLKFSKDMDTFENFFNKTFSECAAPSLLNQNISSSPESNVTNGGELHCPRSETIGIKTDGALKTIQVTKGENLESVYQRYRELPVVSWGSKR